MRLRLVVGSWIALAAVAPALGETPLGPGFTFQGQLKDGGVPLDGTADFQFTLWDAAGSGNPPTGGVQVGGVQGINALPVTAGLFTATLNGGGAFGGDAFNGNTRWLQIAVRSPAGGGVFTTLAPRQPLTAAPQALSALSVPDGVSGSGTTNSLPFWSTSTTLGNSRITQSALGVQLPNGVQLAAGAQGNQLNFGSPNGETGLSISGGVGRADLRFDGTLKLVVGQAGGPPAETNGIAITLDGNVGIGTTAPFRKLDVRTSNGTGISGHGASTGVSGVATATTGTTYGVYGQNSSTSGSGVYGNATNASGITYGVYGESSSTSENASGVYGVATGDTGITYGGRFDSNSTSGRAVSGFAGAGSGPTFGVLGQSQSTSGQGVTGLAYATTGQTFGVRGQSDSTSGFGVGGLANATTGICTGVYGQSNSPSGYDFFAGGGASIAYGGSSSRRWKSGIEPIGQPLDKLGRLRGVYFNWDAAHGGGHDLGMIAEEVGAVLPEIVGYEENGIDAIGMDYSKMTPLLVEAVNALRAEKDTQILQQQERITELTARLERLEKVMAQTGQARNGND